MTQVKLIPPLDYRLRTTQISTKVIIFPDSPLFIVDEIHHRFPTHSLIDTYHAHFFIVFISTYIFAHQSLRFHNVTITEQGLCTPDLIR